jgi:hypothetical protein
MSPFIIPISLLFLFVFSIVLYGHQKGGVEKMLEDEINSNDIDATKRIETARFIDFFHQVKRVDSLYINETTQTIQYKKNNHLSDYFKISHIKIISLFFNSHQVLDVKTFSELPFTSESLDLTNGDIALMVDAGKTVLNIIFDSYKSYELLVKAFSLNQDL